MPLDAAFIACMAAELRDRLSDGRIDKVYQPERDEIVLSVRTPKENLRLIFCAGHQNPRVQLTEIRKPNPSEAPLFCMLMRKHLGGGRITGITQPDSERMLILSVSGYNEMGDRTEKKLVAEFTGRNPNIILLDENGKIIEAAHHVDLSSGRGILPGLTYCPPPLQDKRDPFSVSEEECARLLSQMPDALGWKALSLLFRGLSPMAAKCIAAESTGMEDAPVRGNEEALARGFMLFFERIRTGAFSPSLLYSPEGEVVDFTAYEPFAHKNALRVEKGESMSRLLDIFFVDRDKSDSLRQKGAGLKKRASSILERLYKKIAIHESTLAQAENMEKFRIYGELLLANLHRAAPGAEEVTLENFYDNMAPVTIPLDKTKNVSVNAQLYFKKYRKMKTAAVVVLQERKKAREEAAYMETVLEAIERAESTDSLAEIRKELAEGGYIKEEKGKKKQKDVPSAPLSFKIEDFSVLVGRNNRQNDLVTLRLSRAEDIWLHVKDMPGAHVLIKSERQAVPDTVILRAAALAAYFSGGKGGNQVPVDFTKAKHVWKPSGARPGMVLYDNQHTVYVKPQNPEIDVKTEL